jgi:hypothetical protein
MIAPDAPAICRRNLIPVMAAQVLSGHIWIRSANSIVIPAMLEYGIRVKLADIFEFSVADYEYLLRPRC